MSPSNKKYKFDFQNEKSHVMRMDEEWLERV